MANGETLLASEVAGAIIVNLLAAKGATPDNAAVVSRHLVTSDLAGVRSHGFIRLPQYVQEIGLKEIDPAARPVCRRVKGARIDIDAGQCFGQVAGVEAVRLAQEAAKEHGLGLVTVHQAGHTGRIGAYAEDLAEAGFLGLAVCSGARSGHRVAPFGGRQGRIATNPIAFSLPSTPDPIVGDFSTASAPEGLIRVLRNLGAEAPPDTLLDPEGRPTTDPSVLYRDPPGSILPLGGARLGYRGFALGLLVEALATLLAGDDTEDPGRTGNNLAVMAVEVDEGYRARAARLGEYVRSAATTGPDVTIMLPGEREYRARRGSSMVRVDQRTWGEVSALARECGVPLPEAE
jgi:uncharacterized oxidoreductase